MRFKVTGTYKRNGKHVIALFDARSLEQAEELADAKGIDVQQVEADDSAVGRRSRSSSASGGGEAAKKPSRKKKSGKPTEQAPTAAAKAGTDDADDIFGQDGGEDAESSVDVLGGDESVDELAAALGGFEESDEAEPAPRPKRGASATRSRRGKSGRRPARGEPLPEPDDEERPDQPPGTRAGRNRTIALVAIIAVLIVGGAVGGYFAFFGREAPRPAGPTDPAAANGQTPAAPLELNGEPSGPGAADGAGLFRTLEPYAFVMPPQTAAVLHVDFQALRNSDVYAWFGQQQEQAEQDSEMLEAFEAMLSFAVFVPRPDDGQATISGEQSLVVVRARDAMGAQHIRQMLPGLMDMLGDDASPPFADMNGAPGWEAFEPDAAPQPQAAETPLHTDILDDTMVVASKRRDMLDAAIEQHAAGEEGWISGSLVGGLPELGQRVHERHLVFVYDDQDGAVLLDDTEALDPQHSPRQLAIGVNFSQSVDALIHLVYREEASAGEIRDVLAEAGPELMEAMPRSLPSLSHEGEGATLTLRVELMPQHIESDMEQNPMGLLMLVGLLMQLAGQQFDDAPMLPNGDAWDDQGFDLQPRDNDWQPVPPSDDDGGFDVDPWDQDGDANDFDGSPDIAPPEFD